MPDLAQFIPPGSTPWMLGAAVLVSVGAILVFTGLVALMGLHPLRFMTRTLLGLLLIALGVLEGAITLGIQGYRALTHEEVAARVLVQPTGPQRFTATFRLPGGRQASYALAGDEIYVDAHILKWHPLINMLGLQTAYELDRVEGRYRAIEEARKAQRTVYSIAPERPVDLFGMRRRYAFLAPLVDAEYGSGVFVPVQQPAELEVRVLTGGLIIRQLQTATSNR